MFIYLYIIFKTFFFKKKKYNFFFKIFFIFSFIFNYSYVLWIFRDPLQIIYFFSNFNFNHIIEFYLFKINNLETKFLNKDLIVFSPDEFLDIDIENNNNSQDNKNTYLKIFGGIVVIIILGLIYYNYNKGGYDSISNNINVENNINIENNSNSKDEIVSTGVYIRKFPEIYSRACPPMVTLDFLAAKQELLVKKITSLRLGEASGMTAAELAQHVNPKDIPELKILAKALDYSIDAIIYQVAVLKTGNCVMETAENFIFENGYNFEILAKEFNNQIYENMQISLQHSSDLSFLKRIPKIMDEANNFLNSNEWCTMTKSQIKAKISYILHHTGKK